MACCRSRTWAPRYFSVAAATVGIVAGTIELAPRLSDPEREEAVQSQPHDVEDPASTSPTPQRSVPPAVSVDFAVRSTSTAGLDPPENHRSGVAEVSTPAVRAPRQYVIDPLAPITSPDVGTHCAAGLDASALTAFFSQPIGSFLGADYQRTVRLPDDRVLWTFQDAFIDGELVHNAALIQSGRCFTQLNRGTGSWLFESTTIDLMRWHWILGAGMAAGGSRVALFVVEMTETGTRYLERPRPTSLRRVELDAVTLEVVRVVDEDATGDDLFGWSVAFDGRFTYLYSHCYQQFGYDTQFGFGPCVAEVKVSRLAGDDFDEVREYWDGGTWTTDPERAVAVVDGTFVMSGNNPAQVVFDGRRFLLVEKRDDWWGTTIEFGVAKSGAGPFAHVASVPEPLACDRSVCNTYFASWVPWRASDGAYQWAIGHNVWAGDTHRQLERYRPTFHTIVL